MAEESPETLTDITHMGKLAETLLPTQPDDILMFTAANSLLEIDGDNTTVNGIDTVVTKSSYPIKYGEKKLYVRLGREIRGTSFGDLSFLLCESDDFNFITTPNGYFSNLQFNFSGGSPLLITGTGSNYDTKDPQYRGFAQEAIDGLTKAHMKTRMTRELEEAAFKQAAHERIELDREAKRQDLKRVGSAMGKFIATAGAILGVAYIPQVIWHGEIDSKVGPVPMPWPVELIHDTLNHNKSIHERAAKFKFPAGALPVEMNRSLSEIPVISTYDTTGAPSATSSMGSIMGSQPGLYKFVDDFNGISYDADNACQVVPGNYRDGKTVIFSQTRNINRLIQLRLDDADNLKVCRRKGTDDDAKANTYLYQRP